MQLTLKSVFVVVYVSGWHGYLFGAMCRLFAYGPVDACHCIQKLNYFLCHLNPDFRQILLLLTYMYLFQNFFALVLYQLELVDKFCYLGTC